MALQAMRDTFLSSAIGRGVVMSAIALPLLVLPAYANDAFAGEAQAATATQPEITDEAARPSHMMREMRNFSKDPDTKGIGVYINLQANAPMTGEQIGNWLQQYYGSKNPPIPVEYRVNQSQGTATDITIYIRGVGEEINVRDFNNNKLDTLLAEYRGAWLPETAALDQPIRN